MSGASTAGCRCNPATSRVKADIPQDCLKLLRERLNASDVNYYWENFVKKGTIEVKKDACVNVEDLLEELKHIAEENGEDVKKILIEMFANGHHQELAKIVEEAFGCQASKLTLLKPNTLGK